MSYLSFVCNKCNMMVDSKIKLLLSLFLLHALPSSALYTLHKADKLDLSNNAVLSMHQDSDGYMWIGTYDGLNLYNGKNTFVYRYELDNKFSLCSNIIQNVSRADEDNLWVSTFLGLNKFSLKERRVTESYPELTEARLLAADSKGNTWVIHNRNYISYYAPAKKAFSEIHLPGAEQENIKAFFIDKQDKLCIISVDGKLKYVEMLLDSGTDIKLKVNEISLHDTNLIDAFYEDGNLYYISANKELFMYDMLKNKKSFLSDLSQLIHKYGEISKIVSFKSDLFISFKDSGLIKLDVRNGYKPESVSLGVRIFCLLKDQKQDILWIGTDGRGVQMYHQDYDLFGHILFDNMAFGIQKPIRSIYTDEYNNLWIGTKGDGIVKIKNYDKLNEFQFSQLKHISYTINDGLSNNLVFCFLRSKYQNVIWIGTEGPDFSYYSYKEDRIRTLPNHTGKSIGKVHSICEINDSTLWMATAGNGLLEVIVDTEGSQPIVKSVAEYLLKKGDKTCTEFHSMNYDGKSTLFVGSRGGYGIVRFNIQNKQYDFIPMNKAENSAVGDVLCVHQSKDSMFYIGASSGLTKMQLLSDGSSSIRQFDRKNGIINDMIHGILEDSDGCMWLSSNKGLTKYNPRNDFFHNYSSLDLRVTEFSDDAYWRCPYTKRLFFGGINGLTWVEPKDANAQNDYKPDLDFFDLRILGESYTLYDYTNKNTQDIEIPAKVSSFTISFVAVDYINGENYEYSYLLENYNTAWTELQKTNEITFTNLPYGDYVLKVKYKNDVFDSDRQYYTLKIKKLPPWYLSNGAYIVYIAIFILISILVMFSIRRRIINKQLSIARRLKEEQKEKLLEAKLNFFTNVTHEFCTPLTVINGVSDYMERMTDSDNLKKYIRVLRDNVNNLNGLIQEILDFRKMEEPKFEIEKIESVLISDLIKKQIEWFTPVAESDQIQFILSVADDIYWNTDILCLNRILVNLISNAFKYTVKGGQVKVSVVVEHDNLLLKVYNTGQGIEKSKIRDIFDRYRILDNAKADNSYSQAASRNGIGLSICLNLVKLLNGDIKVESEINNYAEFIVTLPRMVVIESENNPLPIEKIDISGMPVESIENNSAKPTVLVVDDNKDIVWLITNVLNNEYNVAVACNGDDALKIIETQTPSLIITDIMMPSMDGLELIRHIRADKFSKHIPLIIISAKISEKEQAEGLDIGADAYLTKPFSSSVLSSLVNRLLSNKKELKDYFYSPESAYEYTDGQLVHQEDKDFMDSIVSIIEENIEEENLRPELIANKLGINTRALYRRFKKITSLSPNDFIKNYRFTSAARLLITTNLTIQEIIYKVGITNKSYFYREFVKKYSVTPKEYRLRK